MSDADQDERERLQRVAVYAEQQARLDRWRANPREMETRFRALADGGPPDPEALDWASLVVHVASGTAFKLWTMYVRRETEQKAELDELIRMFREKDWRGDFAK